MKKTGLFGLVVLLLFVVTFSSCHKQTELSKMIPSERVELTGDASNLFEIEDSIKVVLIPVGTDGKKWEVRAHLPLKNTTPWSRIPGSDQSLNRFISGVLFYPKYLDRNDTELDLDVNTDYQDGEKLLKSDELITKDVAIKEYNFGDKSYKNQKAYFDLIDGIKITVKLSWAQLGITSSSMSGGSTSSSSQDWNKKLDDYEKYVNEYVKYVKKLSKGDKSVESQVDKYFWAADELEDELDKAYNLGKMTTAQRKRYEKIEEKFTDAVFEYDE